MKAERAALRGPAKSERAPRRGREQESEGVHNTQAGQQGVNPGYWQSVGSTRAAVKRSKRP